MTILQFPTEDDWKRIYDSSPQIHFHEQLNQLETKLNLEGNIDLLQGNKAPFRNVELFELVQQLARRQADITRSYVLLRHYFEMGIPDEEWYQSPGDNGYSMEFYPHFEERHLEIKEWFDYYSETFYQKLFSAWDLIGHILNKLYELSIKDDEVNFAKAVLKLQLPQPNVAAKLIAVLASDSYKIAHSFRRDITHNYLPSSTGLAVTTHKDDKVTTITLGIKSYATSSEIMANIEGVIVLFRDTIDSIIVR